MAGDDGIKLEIKNELMSINAVVTKIKKELHGIIEITQDNGSLDSALENAVDSLLSLARKTGVPERELVAKSTEEENTASNQLSRITTKYITEQLKAMSHN